MIVKFNFLPEFLKQAKSLRKRYASFENDFLDFLERLETNPFMGTSLGNGVRKVRMPIRSKGKGKSGGTRILTFTVNTIDDGNVFVTLLSIYDKAKISNVSDEYIKSLVKQWFMEFGKKMSLRTPEPSEDKERGQ